MRAYTMENIQDYIDGTKLIKNGKVNLNSFIILELNEFIIYMRDKGMEVWD